MIILGTLNGSIWEHHARPFQQRGEAALGSQVAPLRSRQFPLGLPGLSSIDQSKVTIGNKLLQVSVTIVRFCVAHNIPVTLENPMRSRLWWTPQMLRALRSLHGRKIPVDYCAYGTDWQKPTVFAVWGSDIFSDLERRCHRRNGLCQFTGKPHRRLEGTAPGGRNWTAVAEPYPKQLAKQFASLASQHVGFHNLCLLSSVTKAC